MTREPELHLDLLAEELRAVAAAGSKFEAELLAARLRNDGVRAMVGFDHLGAAYAAAATLGSWPVLVFEPDFEAAEKLLQESRELPIEYLDAPGYEPGRRPSRRVGVGVLVVLMAAIVDPLVGPAGALAAMAVAGLWRRARSRRSARTL